MFGDGGHFLFFGLTRAGHNPTGGAITARCCCFRGDRRDTSSLSSHTFPSGKIKCECVYVGECVSNSSRTLASPPPGSFWTNSQLTMKQQARKGRTRGRSLSVLLFGEHYPEVMDELAACTGDDQF